MRQKVQSNRGPVDFLEIEGSLSFLTLKASIGLGDSGLNASPKLGTYIPVPYLVVFQHHMPIFEICFELRCLQL